MSIVVLDDTSWKRMPLSTRAARCNVDIMSHPGFSLLSSVVCMGATKVEAGMPTAATDGRDVILGEAFCADLSHRQLRYVILHENLHKVYQHHWLWKHLWKENAQLANMAADYVINLEILDMSKKHRDFIALPDKGLVDEKYRGMSTADVFNELKKNGAKGEDGLDEHDFTELSPEEQEEAVKEIEQAVRQGALLAGKMGGDTHRAFSELMDSKIDWREQLREFLSSVFAGRDDSTWRRPNRRWLAQNIYLPSAVSETMGSLVIAVDTSGSIGEKELASFLSEICGLCESTQPEALHLLSVDAEVQEHRLYSRDDFSTLRNVTSFKGGGGTDMRTIFDYVSKNNINAEAIVVLTDGYTPYPDSVSVPTLWVMTTDIVAPIGASIHLDVHGG